jgi:predicted phosphoribosyltransferase
MAAYRDRRDAGAELARRLAAYAGRPDVLVLALPRGGVPVAFEVARELRLPLDIYLVRKLGVPGHEELAMGAIASGGVEVVNRDVVERLEIPLHVVTTVAARELRELERRERTYRGDRPPPQIRDKTVILIDDGLATGSTMRAAVQAVCAQWPLKIVVAVPVAAPSTCAEIASNVDEMVCPLTPPDFYAVGMWYDDFAPISDEQVRSLLVAAASVPPVASPTGQEQQDPPAAHDDGPPPAGEGGAPSAFA